MTPTAALFDFNGVLVDDERLHLAGFNEVLAPLGVRVSDEDYDARYIGFDDRGAFRAMLADHGLPHDDARVAALIEAKRGVYLRLAEAELRVFPGAAEALRAAAAVMPVAVVSGALRDEIEMALALMRARDAVLDVVSAEDTRACKPDPEGYLLGLAALRARGFDLEAARCVAGEDSLAGIAAARAAGLKVIGVAQSHPAEALRDAGADLVLASVAELRATHIAALGSGGEVR
ncbi:MAG: HAD family phosphatase [Polyangiales bacterium]